MQSQTGKSLSQSRQLVFLDESGDIGTKTKSGSSPLFIVALTFINQAEAERCNQAIDELRVKLKKPDNYEFHFTKNSDKTRLAFLKTVKPFDYQIIAVSLDKSKALSDPTITTKSPSDLYYYSSIKLVTTALPYLDNATLYIDKTGSKEFQTELRRSIRAIIGDAHQGRIIRYQVQDSHKNNLLQLADYSAAVIARRQMKKPNWQMFYKFVKDKVKTVEEWPK